MKYARQGGINDVDYPTPLPEKGNAGTQESSATNGSRSVRRINPAPGGGAIRTIDGLKPTKDMV